VARPLFHALVGASRFGLLLGLALWLGLGVALCLQLSLFARRTGGAPTAELAGALLRRLEISLLLAMILVIAGLLARVIIDRAAPPTTLVAPIAAMVLSRLLAALAVSPSLRVLHARLGSSDEADAAAPASPPAAATTAERSAFGRLESARRLLVTLEVCLALYAIYAIA
jgi:hypothetical protein